MLEILKYCKEPYACKATIVEFVARPCFLRYALVRMNVKFYNSD